MKIKMKYKYISAVMLVAATHCVSAQNLSTEVVVDRTIAPTLPQAAPLSGLKPSLALTAGKMPELRPGEYTIGSDFSPYTNAGQSPLFNGIAVPDKLPGYLWAGYFPAYRLGIAAGYRFVDTKQNRVSAAVGFDGHSLHTPALNGQRGTLGTNAFKLRADWTHNFASGAVLDFGAGYAHDAVKQPSVVAGETFGQAVNRADIRAGIRRAANLSYHATAHYSLFSQSNELPLQTGTAQVPSDATFGLDGGIDIALGPNARFSTAAGIDFYHCSGLEPTVFSDIKQTQGIATLNPSVDFSTGKLDVRLGVKVQAGISTPGAAFHIAPDISVLWKLTTKSGLYVSAGGGQSFNTLSELYSYSPFAVNSACPYPLYTPVDARAGVRVGSFGGFSTDIHAGYAASHNVPVPSRDVVTGYAQMVAANLSGWYAGATFSFSGNGPVDASLTGRWMASGLWSGFADDCDGAKASIDARVDIRPFEKLKVSLTYRLRACRYYRELNADGLWHRQNMGNISSPGINAEYAVTNSLKAFIGFDNLLCRRTFILPGIASTRLTGLAGISLKF